MNKKFSVIKRIMIVIPSLILTAAIIMSYLYLPIEQYRILQIFLIILGFIAFYFAKKLDKRDKEKE
jgi:hypothetical protein